MGHLTRLTLLFTVLFLVDGPAFAQDRTEQSADTGFHGFRLKMGGLKAGAGLAGGIAYAPLSDSSATYLEVDLVGSIRRYWGTGARLGYRWRSATSLAYGRYRHMPRERFYGFGADSQRDGLSEYRLNERVLGVLLGADLARGFSAGIRSSYLDARPGPGHGNDVPDAVDRYDAQELEGDVRHMTYGAWMQYDSRRPLPAGPFVRYLTPTESEIAGVPLAAARGLFVLAEVVRYGGLDGAPSFTRMHLQSQQFLPIRRGGSVFVLREYLSTSHGGASIPLFMQPALGGAYTLRGYDMFRFRDRHAVLVNAEFRKQIILFTDLALFADAGRVFHSADELTLDSFRTSFGAGLRIRFGGRGLARLDVGRSKEGTEVHFRLGGYF